MCGSNINNNEDVMIFQLECVVLIFRPFNDPAGIGLPARKPLICVYSNNKKIFAQIESDLSQKSISIYPNNKSIFAQMDFLHL